MNYVFAGLPIEQISTLSGKVSSVGLVHVGQSVREGTPLVNVEGMVGVTPTARANVDGIVVEVNVKPGDLILTNQVVVRIERR
jgi:biotin carboxyl carrier protein